MIAEALLLSSMASAPAAQADPLTPGEVAYLNDVHQWMPLYRGFYETDQQLLHDGMYACRVRAAGGYPQGGGINWPLIGKFAFQDLCPSRGPLY